MKSKVTFGRWEAVCLMINLFSTQVVLEFPRTMVETAGTAGWMVALYISLLALAGFAIIMSLYKGFEGKDLIDIGEYAAGGFGRVVTGLILIAYLLFINSVVLREFGEDMKTIALPTSPISFVMMFFLIGMVVAAYMGIEAIARIGAYFVPILIVSYFIIAIGVARFFNLTNMTPVLGTGVNDIFVKGFPRLSSFSALTVLFLITPFIRSYKNLKFAGYASILSSALFFTSSAFVLIAVFTYPIAMETFLPLYQLARLINYGRFFQRVESIFLFMWAAAAFLYLSTVFYFIVYVFKKTFRLKYYRPLIIPFAILVFNLSFFPQSQMTTIMLEVGVYRRYAWILAFVVPILLLSIAAVKKKRAKEE